MLGDAMWENNQQPQHAFIVFSDKELNHICISVLSMWCLEVVLFVCLFDDYIFLTCSFSVMGFFFFIQQYHVAIVL